MADVEDFSTLRKLATVVLKKKKFHTNPEYLKRLIFEIEEITKQGAGSYWVRAFNEGKKWDHNNNGLLLPYLLQMTKIDPITSEVKHKVEYHPDFPDIDIDFLPHARDPVKKYAEEKYGSDFVCSVGLWQRYNPKLALQDACTALGYKRYEAIEVTRNLPEEFDKMSFDEAVEELPAFAAYAADYPDVCDLAYRMTGKIKAQGKHAGGLIISSVPIKDFVPLTLCGTAPNKQWTSAWIEGMAATQLSKFGFVKFDILGLLNLAFIFKCRELIKKSKNIDIVWEDLDPREDRAGWIEHSDGSRDKILLNDPETLKAADDIKLHSIFQFDTDFAMSVVQKGGVKSFMDLVIYTSLGRPGPLPMIDVYIENRDKGEDFWKSDLHPIMQDILGGTQGVLTFQEQLLRTWTELCGFTMPEAEKLQKAVKKKNVDFLNDMSARVIKGAAVYLGQEQAESLWDKMVSFGRYCFNKSHAVAYIVIAYRCLWLKTHYPAEWWAAVLSHCPNYKFVKFIGAARAEGIDFGSIDISKLSVDYTVDGDRILPGLTALKGVGRPTAESIVEIANVEPFKSLEDFVERNGKDKRTLERVIKLGGFDEIFGNRKALWLWYLYCHGNDKTVTLLRRQADYCYCWSQDDIYKERDRQITEYKRQYPKRTKIPKRILDWVPSTTIDEPREFNSELEITKDMIRLTRKIKLTFEQFTVLFPADYSYAEKLVFEKEYLGYYWSSPLGVYKYSKKNTIENAKKSSILDCVIEDSITKEGTRGDYKVLNVTDGVNTARVNAWSDALDNNDEEVFMIGMGVRMQVKFQEKWNSFSIDRNSIVIPLALKDEDEEELVYD